MTPKKLVYFLNKLWMQSGELQIKFLNIHFNIF